MPRGEGSGECRAAAAENALLHGGYLASAEDGPKPGGRHPLSIHLRVLEALRVIHEMKKETNEEWIIFDD